MVFKALIVARSGSLRVENKNIKPFADSSLLAIKWRIISFFDKEERRIS